MVSSGVDGDGVGDVGDGVVGDGVGDGVVGDDVGSVGDGVVGDGVGGGGDVRRRQHRRCRNTARASVVTRCGRQW